MKVIRSPNLVYTPEDVTSLATLLDFDLVMMSVVPYSYFKKFVSGYGKKKRASEEDKMYAVYLKIYTNIEIMNDKKRQIRDLETLLRTQETSMRGK